MLTRKRQLASKIEAVEGSAETLTIAEAKTLAINPKITHDVKMFQRNPARSTLGNLGEIPGQRYGKITFGIELRGSGTATTAPDWGKHIKSSGAKENVLKAMTIGAITNGPFVHGETITGGTSTATGRVILTTVNGTTNLYLVSLTGSFQSGETITGSISGATATTASTATAVGMVYEPETNPPSQTMASYEDGISKVLKGCRGTFKINFKIGEVPVVDFDFSGAEGGVAAASLFTNPSYEATKPPAFLSANLTIDGVSLKLADLTIDAGTTLAPVDSPGDPSGISHFVIGQRMVNGSFTARMELPTTHDFFNKWFSGTFMILDTSWGTVSGNKFRFYAPKIQYTKNDDADQGGLAAVKSTFSVNESATPGDDGWALLCL